MREAGYESCIIDGALDPDYRRRVAEEVRDVDVAVRHQGEATLVEILGAESLPPRLSHQFQRFSEQRLEIGSRPRRARFSHRRLRRRSLTSKVQQR